MLSLSLIDPSGVQCNCNGYHGNWYSPHHCCEFGQQSTRTGVLHSSEYSCWGLVTHTHSLTHTRSPTLNHPYLLTHPHSLAHSLTHTHTHSLTHSSFLQSPVVTTHALIGFTLLILIVLNVSESSICM